MKKNFFVYGLSGSGKDTVSNYLRDNYDYVKLRIAQTIKQIICEKHNLSFIELEQLKRENPKLRQEHHDVSEMLGNKESSMIRLQQLIDGRSMDFELANPLKSRVICDCRDFEESSLMLSNGYHGIFLTRSSSEYKNTKHYTEQFMFENSDINRLIEEFGSDTMTLINNSNNEKYSSNFGYDYITDGSVEALADVIDNIILTENK